jgi:hypothetical protein
MVRSVGLRGQITRGARSQRPAAVSDNLESRRLSEALQNRGRGAKGQL